MSERFSDDQMRAAIEALLDPERFRRAEQRVTAAAPQLQDVLANALAEGGWLDPAHSEHIAKMLAIDDAEERLAAVRTLLAEEVRIGMMIGVAVGWELARELER
jgi:hypothetical protein